MTNNLSTPFVARGKDLFYRKTWPSHVCRPDPRDRPSSFVADLGPSMDQSIERDNPGYWHTAPGNRYAALLLNFP